MSPDEAQKEIHEIMHSDSHPMHERFTKSHPDAIEHVEHIGPELDAKADRPKRRCAFEDAYAVPIARQGERSGEPAKSTACNEDGIFHGRIALAAPALYRFIHDAATI